MPMGSRLGIENKGMLATFVFYVVAGLLFLAWLVFIGFIPHIAIIGIFSLAVAYGIFRKRNWTTWFVIVLFFTATTFSANMTYNYFLLAEYLLGPLMLIYLVLTVAFTVYSISKRRALEK